MEFLELELVMTSRVAQVSASVLQLIRRLQVVRVSSSF
jgi:hypothetical protein